jgi:hypothetical protein
MPAVDIAEISDWKGAVDGRRVATTGYESRTGGGYRVSFEELPAAARPAEKPPEACPACRRSFGGAVAA